MKINKIKEKVLSASKKAIVECEGSFLKFEEIYQHNSQKVLESFIKNKVSESHFKITNGYGYSNCGSSVINSFVSQIFGAESSLVSENFLSGTNAICVALFAIARPGEKILCVTGNPYDTLYKIIDLKNFGSFTDFNIEFNITFYNDKNFISDLKKGANIIYIQRSKGYTFNNSLTVDDINIIINKVKKVLPDACIIVDNCYGEFVEKIEPTEVGADLIIGSLIKNPGGGISPCGAYISGKKKMITLCNSRLIAPGIDFTGCSKYNREIFMGFYYAPRAVFEALKTAEFTAKLFEILGFEVFPKSGVKRGDIVQVIKFNKNSRSDEYLIKFCEIIQSMSPVDSFVKPIPWPMPGYSSEIIMSSGGFVSGSSLELSADAPIREPFGVWLQGGTDFFMSRQAILKTAEEILKLD